MGTNDPIIDELEHLRELEMARHGNDPQRFFEALQEAQRRSTRPIRSAPNPNGPPLPAIRVPVSELRKRLSHFLRRCEAGQEFVICRRGKPVAMLRGIPKRRVPQLGFARGTVVIPPEFFDPLPEDLLRAFEGRGEEPDF